MYAVNVAGNLYVERKRRQLKLLHNNKKVAFITQPTINLHGRRFAEVDGRFTAVEGGMGRLEAKIDHVEEKLSNFENREIDKRLQLEVRVERLEKQRS